MTTRDCDCDHPYPFCVHALGYTGETLAYHSRLASAVIGWPSLNYDQAAIDDHNARMAEAEQAAAAREAATEQQAVMAAKPRVPLGVNQHTLPPPGCTTCGSTPP